MPIITHLFFALWLLFSSSGSFGEDVSSAFRKDLFHICDNSLIRSEMFQFRTSGPESRKASVAGSFYPSSPSALRKEVERYIGTRPEEGPAPSALIVPHAGYVFSGEVAGAAFSRIPEDASYERIFLLGPSHRTAFDGASVDTAFVRQSTPLGDVALDREVCLDLAEGGFPFTYRPAAHDGEHCLEVQIPFIQSLFDQVPPIVPIVIGTERLTTLQQIADVLKPYFRKENLFIISSDFSHYPSFEDARASDLLCAEAISTGKLSEFRSALSKVRRMGYAGQETAACGACGIAVLLSMIEKTEAGKGSLFDIDHVMYRNSGDSPYGDKDAVVGYNSFVFTRRDNEMKSDTLDNSYPEKEMDVPIAARLGKAGEKSLLALARKSIYSRLGMREEMEMLPRVDKSGVLSEEGYGVFVSLYLGDGLRGCIGRFVSDDSLWETVEEMAKAAAFSDPRFPSLSRREAPLVRMEISVLSPLKKISSADEIVLGRDGVYMVKDGRSGTFLPQVATETGWTLEEFLGHCARDKAGIGYWGWRDADLYTYTAYVIEEE